MLMFPVFGGVGSTLLTTSHGLSIGTIMNMVRGHLRNGNSSRGHSTRDRIHHRSHWPSELTHEDKALEEQAAAAEVLAAEDRRTLSWGAHSSGRGLQEQGALPELEQGKREAARAPTAMDVWSAADLTTTGASVLIATRPKASRSLPRAKVSDPRAPRKARGSVGRGKGQPSCYMRWCIFDLPVIWSTSNPVSSDLVLDCGTTTAAGGGDAVASLAETVKNK
ncbi:unnamed protein product [Prorocentrum cordatum]|uniref:Uncharacterized protein n=1 Tax=Prorocentrum cordatum TaxID=2364126 RepID=A0ABN9WM20_9DINO|nr:unnamed protein product [Polarella glacialis]